MPSRLFTFIAGARGPWRVTNIHAVAGDSLPLVERVEIIEGDASSHETQATWMLRGITSNERYVTRQEKDLLVAKQQGLGRPEAICAALIPIRKSARWWALTQDERRIVFEDQSRHIQIGLGYLPAIARRLHHCRDLSENEAFDFVTLFDYAPKHEADFNRLLVELRTSAEWQYVEREVDIRLVYAP